MSALTPRCTRDFPRGPFRHVLLLGHARQATPRSARPRQRQRLTARAASSTSPARRHRRPHLHHQRHGAANEGGDGVSAWAINGRSWPQTERLSYAVGEAVMLALDQRHRRSPPDASARRISRVTSSGDNHARRCRALSERRQNEVVTQRIPSCQHDGNDDWRAPHAGNWLFHCHLHVSRDAGKSHTRNRSGTTTTRQPPHDEHMAGLVLGIHVASKARRRIAAATGAAATHPDARRRASRRELRRRTTSGGARRRLCDRRLAGQRAGTRARARARPPVEITIHNALTNATSVHWHGIELQSSY